MRIVRCASSRLKGLFSKARRLRLLVDIFGAICANEKLLHEAAFCRQ